MHTDNKEQKLEYIKCSMCGAMHEKRIFCPKISDKFDKIRNFQKRNFLWGNILWECLELNISIYDLLYEISYCLEYSRMEMETNLDADLLINYFASELNCNPKNFISNSKMTGTRLMEKLELRTLEFDDCYLDDKNVVSAIRFKTTYEFPKSKYVSWQDLEEIYLIKEKDGDNEYWKYKLVLPIPDILFNHHRYDVIGIDECGPNLLLYEEYSGELERIIEREIDNNWTEIVQPLSNSDVRFDIWLKNIKKATDDCRLNWFIGSSKEFFLADYGESKISIWLNNNFRQYILGEDVEQKEYVYHKMAVRVDKEHSFLFKIKKDDMCENKFLNMIDSIIKSTHEMGKSVDNRELKERRIEYKDVMVINSSLFCKVKGHEVVPYRGIVNILTEDNSEEEYYIYVGYCKECSTYTVFYSDYEKMLEKGQPLCNVYDYSKLPKEISSSKFMYKSQSILAIKGYNVQANSELSEQQRQSILKECLDNDLVKQHDMLEFLNWLIKTREPLPKYKNAIIKWKKDMEFVEKYEEEKRKLIQVQSITIR